MNEETVIWARPELAQREWRTTRLLLRPWRAQDLPAYAALNADPEVMAHFPDVLSKADSDAMAQRCQSLIEARGAGVWAVQRLDTGEFIDVYEIQGRAGQRLSVAVRSPDFDTI